MNFKNKPAKHRTQYTKISETSTIKIVLKILYYKLLFLRTPLVILRDIMFLENI